MTDLARNGQAVTETSPPVRTAQNTVLSVDAMGGDGGPAPVVAGMAMAAKNIPDIRFILHGPEAELKQLLAKRHDLDGRVTIRDAAGVVKMDDKPGHVMRNGQDTSMWSAIDAVRNGEAKVAVSCGNTGALMGVSMVRLRKAAGVNRPAIACLWPSRSKSGFNVMLDVGADIKADADDLVQFALMGGSYARNGLGIETPRIGLLNNGTEEHKGRVEMREAHEMLETVAGENQFHFVGFVEGGDIPSDKVDVIVTDGFTGNVALKTAEGTAKLISELLRGAFKHTVLSRVAALLAMPSLRRLSQRIDPRRVNGGVFLGLNGTVVKSHGSADATGVAAALKLAFTLARSGFTERLAARVASFSPRGSAQTDGAGEAAQDA